MIDNVMNRTVYKINDNELKAIREFNKWISNKTLTMKINNGNRFISLYDKDKCNLICMFHVKDLHFFVENLVD